VVEALVTHQDTYELNRELMAIRTDVPFDVEACNRPLHGRTVAAVLREHGIEDVADRFVAGFALLGRAAWRASAPRG